jgi:hypothetical protein
MGLNTKTYCMTDRQSQCNFDSDFDFDTREFSVGDSHGQFVVEEELEVGL